MRRNGNAIRRTACGGALTIIVAGTVCFAQESRSPSAPPAPAAPPLVGADVVLRELASAGAQPSPVDDQTKQFAAFVAAARELRANQAGLTPRQAAERWLALWDRCLRFGNGNSGGVDGRELWGVLLCAIPRPESWPEIDQVLKARRAALAPTAPGDSHLTEPDDSGILRTPEGIIMTQRVIVLVLQEKFDEALAIASRLNEDLESQVRRLRDSVRPPPFNVRLEAALQKKDEPESELTVPDLLPLLGAEQTRAVAGQVLLAANITRFTVKGSLTLELFREEALKLVNQLPRPPWSLCERLGGGPLQTALTARFGDPLSPAVGKPKSNLERAAYNVVIAATQWRAIEALRDRRRDDAVRLLTLLASRPPSYELQRVNDVDPTFAFEVLSEVAQETRSPAFLPVMLELAPSAGPTDKVLPAIRKIWPDDTPDHRLWLAQLEIALRLAHGETDPAIAALRGVFQTARSLAAASAKSNAGDSAEELSQTNTPAAAGTLWVQSAAQEVALGLALDRGDLVSEGLAELDSAMKTLPRSRSGNDPLTYLADQVADQLLKANRCAEAEHLCLMELRRYNGEETLSEQSTALALLARIYDKAGRPADVMRLLVEAAPWEGTDLAQLNEDGLWMAAARALAATGRKEPALRITQARLQQKPGDDEAYALLLDLAGDRALPLLDQLAAADRWEERPLIWKADLLRRLGRLGEAEACARAALAIDPTDGEQVPGARVRGYAVLADILAAAGKKDDATFFRHVVTSVRVAEAGDLMRDAGLLDAARKKYEEAEAFFADAYCVQWRLADSLQRQGRTAEAEKHYEIAFSRMPEQFGRLATLCFGCENVFGNETSRSAAERVLSRLAAAPQPRPQVFLILARLRLQQDRMADAWALFQRAVAIDPEHLDAWKELEDLVADVDAPLDQQRIIATRLSDLDPAGRHSDLSPDQAGVLGPARLWELLQLDLAQPLPPDELFVLPATLGQNQATDSGKYQQERLKQQRLLGEFNRESSLFRSNSLFLFWLGPLFSSFGGGI